MTRYQCLQYAMDRPGVLTVLPGVRGMKDLENLLGFRQADETQRDYSLIAQFTQKMCMAAVSTATTVSLARPESTSVCKQVL